MVRLVETADERQATNGEAPLKSCAREKRSDSHDAAIDLELVELARQQLRQEIEGAQEDFAYSKIHYEHIMDAKHPETCWRYLAYCQFSVEDALRQMKRSLAWRHTNQVDTAKSSDLIKELWLKAPVGFTGTARDGCDLLYCTGKNYKKPEHQTTKALIKKFILTILFEWDRKHEHDLEQLVIVFDVSSTTLRNIDLDFSAWLIGVREHLPARVKSIYIVGIPLLIRPIIRLVISWMPENLRKIVKCCAWTDLFEGDEPGLDIDQVPSESGGQASDAWRLTSSDIVWSKEVPGRFSDELLDDLDRSICFNTSNERQERLFEMQRQHDKKTGAQVQS